MNIDQELIIPGVELRSLNKTIKNVSMGARMASASEAKGQRCGVTTMCWARFGAPPVPPLTITITRIGPRELDGDNLAGSAKHCRDGVSDWLGVNDRDKRLQWEYRQESQGAKVYAVKIRVATWVQTFDEWLLCDKVYQALRSKSKKAFEAMNRGETKHNWARINEKCAAMRDKKKDEWNGDWGQ